MSNNYEALSQPVAEIIWDGSRLSVQNVRDWGPYGRNPVYSQEYVTALLAALEGKDKRIAELEQRLQQPIKLPYRYSVDCGVCYDPNGGWMSCDDVIETLNKAGFRVEEDAE